MRSFGSDNHSGVHPRVLEAIAAANADHAVAYGEDPWTRKAEETFKRVFGPEAEVFFVFNGTAANTLALSAMLRPFEATVCAETAHIQNDECGAPERFTGAKLLTIPSDDGKIDPAGILTQLSEVGFEHHAQPRAVSISQATELGTVYTPAEIRAIADFAHDHDLLLHVDGARLANAAVALDTSLKELTADCGVDALSFGGTKNGLLGADAVVFFRPDLARDFRFRRKQGMQLASKMRFLAAQFDAYFTDDLWARNARHANRMASLLAERAARFPQVMLSRPVEINQVFVRLPEEIAERLRERHFFYMWDEAASEARWMTSFDTTETDIDHFIESLEEVLRTI
jgi:threonine aldolase